MKFTPLRSSLESLSTASGLEVRSLVRSGVWTRPTAGVARGYLGRAELTAERFVPDPFSGRRGARLYRTGDRARRLADGNIEYLGRNDEQVKYHGYRVELNELRLALSAHAKVRDAVVVLRKDGVGGREQLVGYYVGREAIAVEE